MNDNFYRKDSYALDGNRRNEGFGITQDTEGYHCFFTERGLINILQSFSSEAEVVAHAFSIISKDQSARTVCIGFLSDKAELHQLLFELKKRKICFTQDEIPYNGPRYRVFVNGAQAAFTDDLKNKYYKNQ